jgi:hypothetical protein
MERADFSGVFSEIFDEGVNLAKILMREDEAKIPDDAFGKARESLSEDVYEALVEWGPDRLNRSFMVLFAGNATVS